MKIHRFLILFIVTTCFANAICFAKQLTKEEHDYYTNLKNCRRFSNENFTIYGYEGDKCKVTMTLPVPPNTNMKPYKYTYKIPRNDIYSMVNDAMNLDEKNFKAKWESKEEGYCTEIRYGENVIYSK